MKKNKSASAASLSNVSSKTNSIERRIGNKLTLKTSRSAPTLSNNQTQEQSHIISKSNALSSPSLDVKSALLIHDPAAARQSQEQLDGMHRMVDETEVNLRRALEHAAIRREQLDELNLRSEDLLNKNENLVFGISNYRKTQERDLFWRRFRYVAIGAITLGIIILLIVLSMIKNRSASPSQIIDIRNSEPRLLSKSNAGSSLMDPSLGSTRRRKRQTLVQSNSFVSHAFILSKFQHFSLSDNHT